MADTERQERILELIRKLPEGFVTTYGDLCPEAPRLPGRILATNTDKTLPWHRVVRADGSFAQGEKQRRRLRKEGIPFAGKRVDMEVALLPREALADLVAPTKKRKPGALKGKLNLADDFDATPSGFPATDRAVPG